MKWLKPELCHRISLWLQVWRIPELSICIICQKYWSQRIPMQLRFRGWELSSVVWRKRVLLLTGIETRRDCCVQLLSKTYVFGILKSRLSQVWSSQGHTSKISMMLTLVLIQHMELIWWYRQLMTGISKYGTWEALVKVQISSQWLSKQQTTVCASVNSTQSTRISLLLLETRAVPFLFGIWECQAMPWTISCITLSKSPYSNGVQHKNISLPLEATMAKSTFGISPTQESNKLDMTTRMDHLSSSFHICITPVQLKTSCGATIHLLHLLVFLEFVQLKLNLPFKYGRFLMNLQTKKLIICIWLTK